jgi:uracil phosphoribosyltransferase
VAAADVPINLMAPPLLIPVPLILKGSAMVKAVAPLISRAAPLDIIFVDAVAAPNASLF